MEFYPEKVNEFVLIFKSKKEQIRNSKGCLFLELYRDKSNPNIFFTYSYWDTEQDLENYRNSNFFKNTWAETKILFSKKPEAWSVDKIMSLE